MNQQFIIHLILASLWTHGVHCLFAKGFLFGEIGDWIEDNVAEWLVKPTIGCVSCMSSVHGTLWYMAIEGDFILWPVFCVCLCGLNAVISKMTSKERVIVDE